MKSLVAGYGLTENPLSERNIDPAIKAIMEDAGKVKRAEEEEATKKLIEHYESHIAFCNEYFEQYGRNPGGWNAIFNQRDSVVRIAIEAVSLENQAMYKHEWLSGAWKNPSWTKNHIAILKEEAKKLMNYYDSRFGRWKSWEKNPELNPGQALSDKRLTYCENRDPSSEICLLEQLEKFAAELRVGKHPNPVPMCSTANSLLSLLYKQELEARSAA